VSKKPYIYVLQIVASGTLYRPLSRHRGSVAAARSLVGWQKRVAACCLATSSENLGAGADAFVRNAAHFTIINDLEALLGAPRKINPLIVGLGADELIDPEHVTLQIIESELRQRELSLDIDCSVRGEVAATVSGNGSGATCAWAPTMLEAIIDALNDHRQVT
jgi:hypothetical protein